ncbi:hypothetical protein AVEN_209946-1 [Araneus ventricosus]|uniref:Uncharacterized protein n=2 Tax=Araneus ventricosus TaxID=182803 RepID=A0A4Y2DET7_ARAVE|nr:hypothetical protein AVEN_209946-1 [Araneus ventricosus]
MPTWPCGLRRLPIAPASRIAGSNPRQELEVSSHSTPFKVIQRISSFRRFIQNVIESREDFLKTHVECKHSESKEAVTCRLSLSADGNIFRGLRGHRLSRTWNDDYKRTTLFLLGQLVQGGITYNNAVAYLTNKEAGVECYGRQIASISNKLVWCTHDSSEDPKTGIDIGYQYSFDLASLDFYLLEEVFWMRSSFVMTKILLRVCKIAEMTTFKSYKKVLMQS